MRKETIVIFAPQLARELLRDGYTIVDIKADHKDPDRKRSVFVFRNENGIVEKVKNYKG